MQLLLYHISVSRIIVYRVFDYVWLLFLLPVFYAFRIEFMIIQCVITDKLLTIWRTEINLFSFPFT